jgi:hypothetical protein
MLKRESHKAAPGHRARLTGLMMLLASMQAHAQRLVGLGWDVESKRHDLLGVVAVDPATGNTTVLTPMGDGIFQFTRATFDPVNRSFYLLPGGSAVQPVHLGAVPPILGPAVDVDCTACDGGDCCFSELHWDGVSSTILALGVGFGPAKAVVLVRIDPGTGAVTPVKGASVPATCSLTLDASTFVQSSGIYYALVDCGDDEHDGELVAFDVRHGHGRLPDALSGKIYDTNPVFNTGGKLYAFDGNECLVSIANNKTTAVGTSCSTGGIGGIPVSFGVAPHGTDVYVTIQNFEKRLLAHVDVTAGKVDHVAVPLNIQHLFWDDHPY